MHENLCELERHMITDETFTLLKGSAVLYLSDESLSKIEMIPMEPCTIYNVKKGIWHAIETAENTSVIITENDDTSSENSQIIAIENRKFPLWKK